MGTPKKSVNITNPKGSDPSQYCGSNGVLTQVSKHCGFSGVFRVFADPGKWDRGILNLLKGSSDGNWN